MPPDIETLSGPLASNVDDIAIPEKMPSVSNGQVHFLPSKPQIVVDVAEISVRFSTTGNFHGNGTKDGIATESKGEEEGNESERLSFVRYGVVGTGMMGVEHIRNLAAVGDGVKVTAIADPHIQSQMAAEQAVKTYLGTSIKIFNSHVELLESGLCDVVVVATPNMTHVDVLLDILQHHRVHHVLVEKPLCTTMDDCMKVLAAAERRRELLVQVGLEYRYMPPVAYLLSCVKEGKVGAVRMCAIREHRFPFLVKVNNWNRFNRNTGGTLVEKCCHFFDLMNFIIGADPVSVFASGSQDVNHLEEEYDGERPDILDNAFVIVQYSNGARGMLDLCMFAEGSRNEQEISVVGEKGKVEAFVPEGIVRLGDRMSGQKGVQTIMCHDSRIKHKGLHHGSSFLEHLQFLHTVNSKGAKTPAVTLRNGMVAVAVGVAAHKSIDEQRTVLLSEVMTPHST